VEYQPLTSETGVLRLDSINGGAAFDTTSNLVQSFVVDCDGNQVNEYASSEGGFESLVYDGETGNDGLTVLDLAGNDVITHQPGAGRDEGSIRVNETLAIAYQNLGLTGSLTVRADAGGSDTLVAQGTELSDSFGVDRTTATIGRISLNSQLPILVSGVETYTLNGLDGDDSFKVNLPLATGVATVNINGGGPSGSDSLTLVGEGGVVDGFSITQGPTSGTGNVRVVGSATVSTAYTGVEHLFVEGNPAAADTLSINDDQRDNLWTVSAGTAGDRVQVDGRESIDLVGFRDVTLTNRAGTDLFRIYPTNLSGYK